MDIIHMATFVAVVEENGFTAAAKRLGVAKSVCSRRVSELETDLGAQLIQRSTRSVVATDVGRTYYEDCVDILGRIDAATTIAKCATQTISGRLRLSLPLNYSDDVLAPHLQQFVVRHPDVELVLEFSDRRVDLISGGFDAALRIGALNDTSLVARKIGTMSIKCCAAPSYLERSGTPKNIEDLSNHACLTYTNLSSGTEWIFFRNGKEHRKRVRSIFSSNNGKFNRRMVIAGLGIAIMPDFFADPSIEKGELVHLFPNYQMPTTDIQIVFAKRKNMRASLRTFIDFMHERLKEPTGER